MGSSRNLRSRYLRLGAFMRPVMIHTGAWRYPGARANARDRGITQSRMSSILVAALWSIRLGTGVVTQPARTRSRVIRVR